MRAQPWIHTAVRSYAARIHWFGLACLNHACDKTSKVMDHLFGD